jgi:hypothetical protein
MAFHNLGVSTGSLEVSTLDIFPSIGDYRHPWGDYVEPSEHDGHPPPDDAHLVLVVGRGQPPIPGANRATSLSDVVFGDLEPMVGYLATVMADGPVDQAQAGMSPHLR